MQGVLYDITDYKRFEEQLRQARAGSSVLEPDPGCALLLASRSKALG
jgi:hypothetical protein